MLSALLVTFGAVALVLDRPKGGVEAWLALPLFAAGAGLFVWGVWPHRKEVSAFGEPTLAVRLLGFLTWDARLTKFFPVAGAALIAADLAYNFLVSATPDFLTEDILVLLLAGVFLGYGMVPPRYGRERDFVLLFFMILNGILVAPLLVSRLVTHNLDASVDAYSWVALAPETGAILFLLGIPNAVHAVPGLTAPGLTFTPQHLSVPATLVITTSCSGIYSFGIFASAFASFILTEYTKPDRKLWAFLGLGVVAAYVANVFRMVVIVLVGYYTDTPDTDLQNMLVAHSYAGWFIFLGWTALFWGLLFRFMPLESRAEAAEPSAKEIPEEPEIRGICAICEMSLSPTLVATRCQCGTYLHQACLVTTGRCPRCGRGSRAVAIRATKST